MASSVEAQEVAASGVVETSEELQPPLPAVSDTGEPHDFLACGSGLSLKADLGGETPHLKQAKRRSTSSLGSYAVIAFLGSPAANVDRMWFARFWQVIWARQAGPRVSAPAGAAGGAGAGAPAGAARGARAGGHGARG